MNEANLHETYKATQVLHHLLIPWISRNNAYIIPRPPQLPTQTQDLLDYIFNSTVIHSRLTRNARSFSHLIHTRLWKLQPRRGQSMLPALNGLGSTPDDHSTSQMKLSRIEGQPSDTIPRLLESGNIDRPRRASLSRRIGLHEFGFLIYRI